MSAKFVEMVWKLYPGSGHDLVIMLALAETADGSGVAKFVPDTIAPLARLSVAQVCNRVHAIAGKGQLIEVNAAHYRIKLSSKKAPMLFDVPQVERPRAVTWADPTAITKPFLTALRDQYRGFTGLEDTIAYWLGNQGFRMQVDKQGFLIKKIVAAIERNGGTYAHPTRTDDSLPEVHR